MSFLFNSFDSKCFFGALRAVGVLNDGTMIWFWVESHKAYALMLRTLEATIETCKVGGQ
jgi:hypothetical protein